MVVGEFTVETELVVIGGGPGGYSAAFRAAELGTETTLVDDRDRLGGSWLHEGCMLSKDLVHLAEVVRAAEHARTLGVELGTPRYDCEKIRLAMQRTVDTIATDLEVACRERRITWVAGCARFDDSRQLSIASSSGTPRLRFKRAIISTGSRNRGLGELSGASSHVLSSSDALQPREIPGSLLVVGGSTCALELAAAYAALGSRVSLVDPSTRLVTLADDDLVAVLHAHLDAALEEILLETRVVGLRDDGSGVVVHFAPAGAGTDASPAFERRYDRVLTATGRHANVESLQLERTAVQLGDDGFILVDKRLRTTDPRIHAVGDVVGAPLLALKAMQQGRIAAEVVAGWGSVFDVRAAPVALFTDPQMAWCGLTERDSAASGQTVSIQRTAPRDSALHRAGGFTKIIYDPDTKLVLGVGIVGTNAAELIAEGALAIEMGAVTSDLAAIIHPHPTRSECIARAAQQAEATLPP